MGVDLTAIPTIGVETALVLAAEVGPNLSRFPSESHFSSWLNVAPPTRITGGKPLRGAGPKILNRAGQSLRQAAVNARRSDSFIGASHRTRLARMDSSPAIKATATSSLASSTPCLLVVSPMLSKGSMPSKLNAVTNSCEPWQETPAGSALL